MKLCQRTNKNFLYRCMTYIFNSPYVCTLTCWTIFNFFFKMQVQPSRATDAPQGRNTMEKTAWNSRMAMSSSRLTAMNCRKLPDWTTPCAENTTKQVRERWSDCILFIIRIMINMTRPCFSTDNAYKKYWPKKITKELSCIAYLGNSPWSWGSRRVSRLELFFSQFKLRPFIHVWSKPWLSLRVLRKCSVC